MARAARRRTPLQIHREITSNVTHLAADWRHQANWRVWAMLAKIDQSEYEAVVSAFEKRHAGVLSVDWTIEWRRWCRAILIERSSKVELIADLF